MSRADSSGEWPRTGRAGRAGNPPTELQEKIIEHVRRWNMPPFGEPISFEEILEGLRSAERVGDRENDLAVPDLTEEQLTEELDDAVLAGWLKMTLPCHFEPWERPRPERTDLPVEDRERREAAGNGMWKDASGGKHLGNMGYEGDDAAAAEAMQTIRSQGLS